LAYIQAWMLKQALRLDLMMKQIANAFGQNAKTLDSYCQQANDYGIFLKRVHGVRGFIIL